MANVLQVAEKVFPTRSRGEAGGSCDPLLLPSFSRREWRQVIEVPSAPPPLSKDEPLPVDRLIWRALVASAVAASLSLFLFKAPVAAAMDEARLEYAERSRLIQHSLLLGVAASGNHIVAVGDRGHVLLSVDHADSWIQVLVPTRSMLTAVRFVEGGLRGWAVGHDAVILHTADGGKSWIRQHWDPGLEQPLFDVWFEDSNYGMAIGAYGLFLETKDGGETWRQRAIDEDEPHFYLFTRSPAGVLYIVGEFGSIYRSEDVGRNWIKLPSPYEGSFFGALALADESVLAFGLRGNLYRSDDKGMSWEKLESGTTAGLFNGVVTKDGSIVLVGQSGVMSISRDRGKTFIASNVGNRDSLSGVWEVEGRRLLLVGEGGVRLIEKHPGLNTKRTGDDS